MKEDVRSPQINSARIPVGGSIAGALCVLVCMAICLIRLPELRYIFPISIAVGSAVALVLHFMRHKTTGAPWILTGTKK